LVYIGAVSGVDTNTRGTYYFDEVEIRKLSGSGGFIPTATPTPTATLTPSPTMPPTETATFTLTPTPAFCPSSLNAQAKGIAVLDPECVQVTPTPPPGSCTATLITSETYQNIKAANPSHVNELEQMIIISEGGMRKIRGPFLNAADGGNPDIGNPLLGWGDTVTVYSSFKAHQTNYLDQVWYKVGLIGSGYDGVWIVARYEGEDYIQGGDSCSEIVGTPDYISFPYDRKAAANYAIEHSYQNATFVGTDKYPSRTGHVTLQLTNNLGLPVPFANFNYSSTFAQPHATGSALFISETLWAGGFPMTVHYADDVPDNNGMLSNSDCNPVSVANMGWRICSSLQLASNPWDNHEELFDYYTTWQGGTLGNNLLSSKGVRFNFPGISPISKSSLYIFGGRGPQNPDAITDSDLHDYIPDLRSGVIAAGQENALSNYVATTMLGCCDNPPLQQGDYIYLDIPTGSHGALVIGWQEALSCPLVITPPQPQHATIVNFASSYQKAIDGGIVNPVPWIADFAELYYPTPRPFYCTPYLAPGTPNWFYAHNWWFFSMPGSLTNSLTIPTSELYIDPNWNW